MSGWSLPSYLAKMDPARRSAVEANFLRYVLIDNENMFLGDSGNHESLFFLTRGVGADIGYGPAEIAKNLDNWHRHIIDRQYEEVSDPAIHQRPGFHVWRVPLDFVPIINHAERSDPELVAAVQRDGTYVCFVEAIGGRHVKLGKRYG